MANGIEVVDDGRRFGGFSESDPIVVLFLLFLLQASSGPGSVCLLRTCRSMLKPDSQGDGDGDGDGEGMVTVRAQRKGKGEDGRRADARRTDSAGKIRW